FIRHANDTQWVIPELVPELRRRGLDVEGGGHVLVELLPRSLFATHPEYFPLAPDGRRSDLGNVCTASAEALAVVRERAVAARAASTCSSTTATRSSSAAARCRSPRSCSETSTATRARACAASPASSSDATVCGRTA